MFEDVVAQHHDDVIVFDESLRQAECLRDPTRFFLVCIEESVNAPLLAIPEESQELTCVGATSDEHDVRHLGSNKRLDGVGHHRAIVDWQQVLIRNPSEWVKSTTGPAGQD